MRIDKNKLPHREFELETYIVDDTETEPLMKKKCQFMECSTNLNQTNAKKHIYCSCHQREVLYILSCNPNHPHYKYYKAIENRRKDFLGY